MNRQPSTLELAAKIGVQLWIVLFWLLVVFVVAVVVWVLAGPGEAIAIFVVAVLLFGVLPYRLARRRS